MSLEDAPASVAGEKRTNIFAGLTREPMEVEEYAAIAPPEARGLTLAWNAMLADMQPLWAISQRWPPFVDAWRQGLVDELGNVNDLEDIDVYCQVACGPQGFVDDGVPVLWGELPEGASCCGGSTSPGLTPSRARQRGRVAQSCSMDSATHTTT